MAEKETKDNTYLDKVKRSGFTTIIVITIHMQNLDEENEVKTSCSIHR